MSNYSLCLLTLIMIARISCRVKKKEERETWRISGCNRSNSRGRAFGLPVFFV